MIIASKTSGKVTILVDSDKKSKYYLTESGDIINVDEDYLLHQIALIGKTKRRVSITIRVKSISEETKNKIIKKDNSWVDNHAPKHSIGSLYTMLNNKGYY